MITAREQRELERIHNDLLRTLRAEMRKRQRRDGWVDGEPEWVRRERNAMFVRVNRWRGRRRMPPVDLTEVERAEEQAEGHIDFASKWSLYCAELVLGITMRGVQV
jgi:hypothetical protein